MKIFDKKNKIAKVIEENPLLILAFERMGVNLGVEEKTIEEEAKLLHQNPDTMVILLNMQHNKDYLPDFDFHINDAELIVRYLKQSHQYFTSEVYPRIKKNIDKLVKANSNTGVKMIESFFNKYRQEVDNHFNYENDVVFPYVLSLIEKHTKNEPIHEKYSVEDYKQHHDNIEEKLEDLKHLLIKFLEFDNDNLIRRNILLDLFHLEEDLAIHSRIENELLIPLVEKTEKKLN